MEAFHAKNKMCLGHHVPKIIQLSVRRCSVFFYNKQVNNNLFLLSNNTTTPL